MIEILSGVTYVSGLVLLVIGLTYCEIKVLNELTEMIKRREVK